MKHEISVHKAQSCHRQDGYLPDLEIKAEKELPEYDHIDASYAFFRNDANMIFQGLIHCLPGGTVDQLLLLLLEYKASQFIAIPIIIPKITAGFEIDVSNSFIPIIQLHFKLGRMQSVA